MLLVDLFDAGRLNEGGNMFPDSADIPKAAAGKVLANLKKALPPQLANQAFATGSAGVKDVSGDMDVMLDNSAVLAWSGQQDQKAAKAALKAALEKAGLQTALSGISVHVRVPMGDKFAQVDIMLVDDAASISRLHQHDYAAMGTTYKGKHKHFILSSAAKAVKTSQFPNGLMWSAFQGLFSRGADGKKANLITNDPDTIAKMLLNPNATAEDLASPQSIVAAIPKAQRAAKLSAARDDFAKEGIPLPETVMEDVQFINPNLTPDQLEKLNKLVQKTMKNRPMDVDKSAKDTRTFQQRLPAGEPTADMPVIDRSVPSDMPVLRQRPGQRQELNASQEFEEDWMDTVGAFGRNFADTATLGGYKYARAGADYLAKNALNKLGYADQGTTYDKELDQEIEKLAKDYEQEPGASLAGMGAAMAIPSLPGEIAAGAKAAQGLGGAALDAYGKAVKLYPLAKSALGYGNANKPGTAK